MYKKIFPVLLPALCSCLLQAQIKWDGEADGKWTNPVNWTSNTAPVLAPSADIVLDNSVVQNDYTVKITGSDSIVINSLLIAPAPGKTITLLIDASSTKSIALSVLSAAQGIVLENGARLVNASGASAGEIISVTDSLRINTGGLYSHQTRRAHATLVSRLSRRTGTEEGVFEFNIPFAGNTISLSNQVYGTLRLSAAALGSNVTYSGGAINPLLIRGDLELLPGAALSLNFSDTVFIRKNLIQHGGSFNLANSDRNTIVAISGDIDQKAGVINKTGIANPEIILNGKNQQGLAINGTITGNIIIRIDNPQGVVLQTPVLIPYILDLKKGRVFTSTLNLLTLATNSRVLADSTNNNSFIHGPLRKLGLSSAKNFLFPVGKDAIQRWVCLKNATGNFTVEFFRVNPYSFSNVMGSGIHHISSLECWSIDATPPATAKIELSYNDQSSGGITDMSTLRVAKWTGQGSWENTGNTATTGTAGGSGSVLSNDVSQWSAPARFTLGSSSATQNALPITLLPPAVRPEPQKAGAFNIKGVVPVPYGLKCLIDADAKRMVAMELMDLNGRRLRLVKLELAKGINTIHLNLQVSDGIYMIRVADNGGSGKPPLYCTYRFFVGGQ